MTGRRLSSYLRIPLVVLLRIASSSLTARKREIGDCVIGTYFLESWVTKIPVANEEELKVFVPSRFSN